MLDKCCWEFQLLVLYVQYNMYSEMYIYLGLL